MPIKSDALFHRYEVPEMGILFKQVQKKIAYLFIWLCWFLAVACGISFSHQGLNLGPLHWEPRVLATGPPRKSLY